MTKNTTPNATPKQLSRAEVKLARMEALLIKGGWLSTTTSAAKGGA